MELIRNLDPLKAPQEFISGYGSNLILVPDSERVKMRYGLPATRVVVKLGKGCRCIKGIAKDEAVIFDWYGDLGTGKGAASKRRFVHNGRRIWILLDRDKVALDIGRTIVVYVARQQMKLLGRFLCRVARVCV